TSLTLGPKKVLERKEGTRMAYSSHSDSESSSCVPTFNEGGGDYVSSPKSNEAPPTTAATAAGGAEDSAALTDLSLKLDRCINRVTTLENKLGVTKKVLSGAVLNLVSRVKRLEGLLQQRKRRLVLSDFEDEEAAKKEQDINLYALHKLASTRTRTTRRHLRKTVTSSPFEHLQENISADEDTIPADAQTIHAGSTPIPSSGGVSAGSKRSWHRRLKLKVLLHLLNKVQGCQLNAAKN
nr:hypothetical protein [Tanacetum cinerariifolium]